MTKVVKLLNDIQLEKKEELKEYMSNRKVTDNVGVYIKGMVDKQRKDLVLKQFRYRSMSKDHVNHDTNTIKEIAKSKIK